MRKMTGMVLCAAALAGSAALALPWTVETVDSSGGAGRFAALAIDAAGGLHVCHYDSLHGDLRYARRTGGAWSLGAIDTAGDVGRFCAIVVGPDNNPRVSYYDSTNRSLKYGYFNGASWTLETADPGPGVGLYTSICLLGTTALISYYDQANRDLKLATRTASWALAKIDTAGDVGRYTSVANSGNNQTRISYYSDTQRQLQFARQQGINWVKENPDPALDAGIYSSLVLSGDVPAIAYFDSAAGGIKRAVKPSGWVVDTVDNTGAAGGHVSMALGPGGQPLVSYHDRIGGDLRLARYAGSAWLTEAVDTAGIVGLHTSCKVRSDSTVFIAYCDLTRGRLKLASAFLDIAPPLVAAIAVAPDTVWQAGPAVLTGRITDNRMVAGGEYFIDSVGPSGTGRPVHPADSFGGPEAEIFDTILTASLAAGLHRVYLHGRDAADTWGAFDSTVFVKAGADTIPPTFAIKLSPAAPAVGAVLSVSAEPSEPLHPDSAAACTLRTSDGALRPVVLVRDSGGYAASLPTAGFPAGACRLTVAGYDRCSNRGSAYSDFRLDAAGSFLPDELVYAWPNPARADRVHFHYYVNANAQVTAEVYTIAGRRVARLTGRGEGGRPPHQASSNAIVWDITGVASDVYLLRLTATADVGGEQRSVNKKFAIVR